MPLPPSVLHRAYIPGGTSVLEMTLFDFGCITAAFAHACVSGLVSLRAPVMPAPCSNRTKT
ncbi:hypothetical protein Cantr_07992 [Candida viswanathii]|uniref:Uncharacterized protein n=1 Tax=Candida viswanathii TaxID=5486 RepID=A0A367Y505_9ASCO|nr:hypothetical protein Cantr_07992 [Candida viswanathii]